jgi:hypothetical protein
MKHSDVMILKFIAALLLMAPFIIFGLLGVVIIIYKCWLASPAIIVCGGAILAFIVGVNLLFSYCSE